MTQFHQPYDPYYTLQQQPSAPAVSDWSGINTLFVSGLPDDVKPREIHNLFRRRPGFDSCQLKYTGRGNQVVAFATFFNHQSAIAAMHSLNGVKFDPQTGSTLHIELARSNSRRKRRPGNGAYVVIDKRTEQASNAQETSSDDGGSDSDEPPASSTARENADSENKGDVVNVTSEPAGDPDNAPVVANEQSEKGAEGGVHACSTLFIANLGPNCTEDELRHSLSQYPGFNVLKLRAKGGMPVAFADFEVPLFYVSALFHKELQKHISSIQQAYNDAVVYASPIHSIKKWIVHSIDDFIVRLEIEQATKAMEELQGTLLPSSDRGGMHIEYARSKMRKP